MARALQRIFSPARRNHLNGGHRAGTGASRLPILEDTLMLENFRKKDVSRPGYTPSPSPYGRMQEALSPTPPAPAEAPKPELLKPAESSKPELPKAEVPKPESPRTDTAHSAKPSNKGEESVSKLIVGPDIKLKGAEITDCDTLVVEGRVEAAMESRVLQIAQIGEFVGKAAVDMAEIRGRFDGELTVRKQLVIRATGHVSGKIRYGKISIEEGGELSGDIGALGPAPVSAENRSALAVRANTPPR
jgi:cytoskeletal protein CcmA (bactofilin family)